MKVLALEPYYGGSHRAFLDGWIKHSEHDWTLFHLPPFQWKWRMHHAAGTFAEQAREAVEHGGDWDLLFCSSMLDLATFLGLAPALFHDRPRVVYFHENQLTYPLPEGRLPDYHYAFIHLTTGQAATRVWFNSAFHQAEFFEATTDWIKNMPKPQPLDAIKRMKAISEVLPQGIDPIEPASEREPGPLRILWAARWEYDKNAEGLFAALDILDQRGVDFRLSVIGQQFRKVDPCFAEAREKWSRRIDHWGYLKSKEDYLNALRQADVAVSTAIHEFFGIGMVEAAAAGAFPLVPNRLSYPEVFDRKNHPEFFYEDDAEDLAERLIELNGTIEKGTACKIASRFFWPDLARRLDRSLA